MAHTDSGAAAIVMVSDADSAMVCILPDLVTRGGDVGASARRRRRAGNEPWIDAHRPLSPNPSIGTRKPTASDDPGLPSGPSGRARVVATAITTWASSVRSIVRRTREGVGGPSRKYSWTTEISSVRLRCTAFQYAQRKVKTPTANSVMAVTAPIHWAVVETPRLRTRPSGRTPVAATRSALDDPDDVEHGVGSGLVSRRFLAVMGALADAERFAEAGGEHVVGELLHRPARAARPIAARAGVVVEQRSNADGRLGDVLRATRRRGRSRRRPPLRPRRRSRRPPVARRTRRPRRTRCRSLPARARPTGCGTAW